MPELPEDTKSCPHCGSRQLVARHPATDRTTEDGRSHFIHCRRCLLDGPVGSSEDEALTLWNTRVPIKKSA